MKTISNTKSLVLLGLLTALVAVFSFTIIGSIPIGPLVITLNVIPVAIAAVSMGPAGGAIIGGVFGIFSFLQCFSIGTPSLMGIALLEETGSPLLCFLQRFLPRLIDGLLVGLLFNLLSKKFDVRISCAITGFCAALFNTLLFMSSLVIAFGSTEYMKNSMAGKSFIAYIVASISVNAIFEMIAATVVTGAVGYALYKAKLITVNSSKVKAEKAA